MKLKLKLALLALGSGMIAMGSGACFFRWLGDFVGDVVFFRGID